jgi:16S rRNA (cytidine1402-2'-O)-methyltransferase
MSEHGKLTLVATPIGNLGDLTDRARAALQEADFWIVEDTRISGKLASHLSLRKPMRVLNEHTPSHARDQLLRELVGGGSGVLMSDGGTPSISDPGAMLCDACHEHGVEVDALPGPSAVTTAVAVSGFFGQQFAFLGFMPRKHGAIVEAFRPFDESTFTLVFFESPYRIDKVLDPAFEALGERRYAICRELSKVHQQIYRDILPKAPSVAEMPRKGEITVVIEGLRRGAIEG